MRYTHHLCFWMALRQIWTLSSQYHYTCFYAVLWGKDNEKALGKKSNQWAKTCFPISKSPLTSEATESLSLLWAACGFLTVKSNIFSKWHPEPSKPWATGRRITVFHLWQCRVVNALELEQKTMDFLSCFLFRRVFWPICPYPWIHCSMQIRPGVLPFHFQTFNQAQVGNARWWDGSRMHLSKTKSWTLVSKMWHHLLSLANHIKPSGKHC